MRRVGLQSRYGTGSVSDRMLAESAALGHTQLRAHPVVAPVTSPPYMTTAHWLPAPPRCMDGECFWRRS